MILATLSKIIWPYMQGFISKLYSIPLAHMTVFMLVQHSFNYCRFGITFGIRKYETFDFVLFLRSFWLFGIYWDSIWILECNAIFLYWWKFSDPTLARFLWAFLTRLHLGLWKWQTFHTNDFVYPTPPMHTTLKDLNKY